MKLRLKYLGDVLSLLRALAVYPFFVFVTNEAWVAAALTLALAWGTDPFDGPAARRWGGLSDRFPKLDVDGITDTILAVGSTGTVAYYMGERYGYGSWAFDATLILAVSCFVAGTGMVIFLTLVGETPVTPMHKVIVGGYMVWGHSVLQIGATLAWAAYMAIGNAGIWIVVGVFGILALNQKDKIALWMEGRLR